MDETFLLSRNVEIRRIEEKAEHLHGVSFS